MIARLDEVLTSL